METKFRRSISIVLTGLAILFLSSCNVLTAYQSVAMTLTMAANFAATPSNTPLPWVTIIPSAGDLGWGAVHGLILDGNTGLPLTGATVTCQHSSYTGVYPCFGSMPTSQDGGYTFTPVFFHDTDQITLFVEAPGYESIEFKAEPLTRADLQINLGLFPLLTASPTWTPTSGVACTPPSCSNGQLVCGSADGCPGGCGTVCQPSMMCTPPACAGGQLVCGAPDGCPGGCGTICQVSGITPEAGTVIFDFAAQLCSAQWMNGGQQLTACPVEDADHSGGLAELANPTRLGFPNNTLVLRTIPAWNGYSSLFLRYPGLAIDADDRFQTVLTCDTSYMCDVQFALEYYDANGKYHSPFMTWDFKSGDAPIKVDVSLQQLAGQKVDLVLTLRLFHSLNTPNQDNGLWISPRIFRPAK